MMMMRMMLTGFAHCHSQQFTNLKNSAFNLSVSLSVSRPHFLSLCLSYFSSLTSNSKNKISNKNKIKSNNGCRNIKIAKNPPKRRQQKPTFSSQKTRTSRKLARLINTKPWSDDLESSLSSLSPSPFTKTTVLQTLRQIRTPTKALKFFNYTQQLGYSHDQQSYFLMLEILGKARNLNAARNFLYSIEKKSGGSVKLKDCFFNSLIRSYGNAGLFQESIKLFSTMKSIGVSPSVVTFNSLLSILLKRGRTNMARNVYDEMLKTYGVTPDAYTFNILIRGFCMNSMVDEGFVFFKEMSRLKCDPDVVTYNTLVDGLCRAGKVNIAHNVLKGMCKKSLVVNPNVVTYTTLIRGYCMKKDIPRALNVFEEMVIKGLKPNRITYNTIIQGLCEVQNLEKIKEVLEGAAGREEFVPDTCTFNTLISAHCNAGNIDESLEVFKKMSQLKVQPDSATYSPLLRSLCQQGNFKRAEELFDELSEKEILLCGEGSKPLVAAYNPIFEYLCANGKTKKAERVFRQLFKRGTPDPLSFKILILGHCKEGTYEAGFDLLVLMLRRDYVPDFETYQSLIEGLLHKGDPILAHKILEKMLKSSHIPKASDFHVLLQELLKKDSAQEAASVLVMMLHKKVRQNINLSTGAIRLLLIQGLRDKAFEVLGLIYENGYSVNMEELIRFLSQRKKFQDAQKMLLFSLDKDHEVDVEICGKVLNDLCKSHRVSEAFELYYALVEKGKQLDLLCLEDLRVGLEAEGKSKEAEFLLKRIKERATAI
ncbi:Pentatricopeptide repeat [Dillenia turbinata]|uniref:Pentatricopeptide repeat n=1 Tax=Dillenia turbinata TaxID=194707 RepID=A0AAN8VLM6_9MAGN